jgi:hypothetical protein
MTHDSLQQGASDDSFFKLKSLKSRNDSNIVIGLEKWDLYMNLWGIKFCESNSDPIKSQIEGLSFNKAEPRSKDNNISDYYPQHKVSTHPDLSSKTGRIGFWWVQLVGSFKQNNTQRYESTANIETIQLKHLGNDSGDLLSESKPKVNKKPLFYKIPLWVRQPTTRRIQPSEAWVNKTTCCSWNNEPPAAVMHLSQSRPVMNWCKLWWEQNSWSTNQWANQPNRC